MTDVAAQLLELDRRCRVRVLELNTPRKGSIDMSQVLKHHVQGVTRVDMGDKALVAVSVSGVNKGTIWLAEFERVADGGNPGGARRLAKRGNVVRSLTTKLAHPGGMQACGQLLAVASEADHGYARIDIYDLRNQSSHEPQHSLILNNSLKEGVSQLTGSQAGWLACAELTKGEYLLFVGGRKFAAKEGWFYRYLPNDSQPWVFEGNFRGLPTSRTPASAWGPQSCAAMVRAGAGAPLQLVTFGSAGAKSKAARQSQVRCFGVRMSPNQPCALVHEPVAQPSVCSLPHAGLSGLFGPNARWGSTAFVDEFGRLSTYFTARNPRPDRSGNHLLEIAEVWNE